MPDPFLWNLGTRLSVGDAGHHAGASPGASAGACALASHVWLVCVFLCGLALHRLGVVGQGLELASMLHDLAERPFILVGFMAFVLMTALALTSTQAAMRRLGRHWQQLHRAVYLIGLLAVLHYWWHKAGKNDFREPLIYGAVLFVLLGWRVAAWVTRRREIRAGPS
ncbi:hypothetical protein FYA90_14910 [Bordetella holmesii]|nr:hypothetical protein FYA90_14910 [Bordetella holmesii]